MSQQTLRSGRLRKNEWGPCAQFLSFLFFATQPPYVRMVKTFGL